MILRIARKEILWFILSITLGFRKVRLNVVNGSFKSITLKCIFLVTFHCEASFESEFGYHFPLLSSEITFYGL